MNDFIITINESHESIYSSRMVFAQLYIDLSDENNEL